MIEILKTVHCNARSPTQVKLREMEPLYGRYSNHVLCDALDVPRETFLNHIKRNKKGRKSFVERREALKRRISEIFDASRQCFGAAKIAAKLKEEGISTSKEMIHELMLELGLFSIRVKSKAIYRAEMKTMRNIVQRNFDESEPNRTWVSDVTDFRYKNIRIHICVVMDLFSRRIIGDKFSHSNNTHLLKMTFRQAYESRNPGAGLIFHSDQGGNYISRTLCLLFKSLGVRYSFSHSHTPYDNSVAEAFFASLKTEELYRQNYRFEAELKDSVLKYIEFFNNERPHKALNYLTPAKKEELFFAKPTAG